MTDTREGDKPAGLPVWVLYNRLGRQGEEHLPNGVSAAEMDDRQTTLNNLNAKMQKLTQSDRVLEALQDGTTDSDKYNQIAAQLDDLRAEFSYCRARYSAINRGLPFKGLSQADETALLNAIHAVNQAIANTQAWGALLAAVHGLIEAYAARDTEAAT